MSLGQVRPRPKANKPSINNMSAVEGGLWGREPNTYGQRIVDDPYGVVPHGGGGGGGGIDFLSRVEQAEARDSDRQRSRVRQKGHQAYARRSVDGGMMDDGGGVSFGGDSMANQQRDNRFQTSNSAVNSQMQQMHEQAVQRQHEQTIRTLLREQHGLSEADAEHEIKLWRQEQAAGKAAPIPSEEAQAPNVQVRRAARGENGQFLHQAADFQDPFKVRTKRSATPPKSKPWEIDNGFKQRSTSYTPQQKVKPFEVSDPFKMRTSASPPSAHNDHAAGGYTMASGPNGGYGMDSGFGRSQFHVDPNASSIAGGIFG